MNKLKEMETRIAELERVLDQKQINIYFLEKMIDLAKEEYDIDFKEISDTLQSSGSKTIKPEKK